MVDFKQKIAELIAQKVEGLELSEILDMAQRRRNSRESGGTAAQDGSAAVPVRDTGDRRRQSHLL